jgi:Asp-tRNA(Asn)/Glu-tRNA(Gln) amidotransferase C subunit
MSEQNLGKLLNRLDKLQKDRYDIKKMQEYYGREKTTAEDDRKFGKYRDKEDFLVQKLANLDKEILLVQDEIQSMENTLKEDEYRKDLTGFYREVIEHLTTLKEALEEKKISDATEYLDHIEGIFQQSNFVKKEDVNPIYQYLPFQSIRIRLGRIHEEMGEEVKINATVGVSVGAQKRSNIAMWIGNLVGQINTLIEMLEQRINGSK